MMLIVVEKRRKGKGDLKTRHWLAIHIKKGRKEKEWKKNSSHTNLTRLPTLIFPPFLPPARLPTI